MELLATRKDYIVSVEPVVHHASQMAALDYIVSVESDVIISSYTRNMASFLGHRRSISPERKALVRLFDELERGTMKGGSLNCTREGKNLQGRENAPFQELEE